KFVSGVDAIEVFAGNAHELRQSSAGADVDGVESLFVHEFIDGDGAADDDIGFEFNAHLAHVVELLANDLLGQAKLGNTVDQHSAQLVKCLEDSHFVTLLNQVPGDGEARRAAADDCYFFSGRRNVGQNVRAHALLVIGDKALQIANAERLHFFRQQTLAFAVILLRADSSGNGGQHVIFANLGGGAEKISCDNQLDELFHLHANGAGVGAGGLGTFQATQRLLPRQFRTVAEIHFGEILVALVSGLLGHRSEE